MISNKSFYDRGWPALLVFVAACAVYAGGVNGAFMWDDINLVLENQRTHGLSHLPQLLGWGDFRFGFRLVRDLSYAVDYSIGGLSPLVYHLSNLLYHGITAWLVYLLIRCLTRCPAVAFWGGLLFAIHPIHVDAVAYISGRRDILSALFYLAGMLAFIRFRDTDRWHWFGLAALCGALGVMAKEMAATLPAAWFLYDAWRAAGSGGFVAGALKAARRHWPLYGGGGALAGAFIAYVVLVQGLTHGAGPYGGTLASHVMTEVVILAYGLKVLLLPIPQLVDYQHFIPAVHSPLEPRFIVSLLVLLGLILLCTRLFSGKRNAAFAMHWLWITYLPVMQIVPHPERFAEHYLYLPSVGPALLAGMGIARLLQYSAPRWRTGAVGLVAVLLVALVVRTVDRTHDYRSPIAVFEAARQVHPEGMRIINNLALAYGESGQKGKAIALLTEGVERIPGPLLTKNLARYLRDEGRYQEAERWLLDAYGRVPDDLDVLDLLGDTFFKMGKYDDALKAWSRLQQLRPDSIEAQMGLANLARAEGKLQQAAVRYEAITVRDPNRAGAWVGLGICRQRLGDVDGARVAFERVLALDPQDGDAWNNLGMIALKQNRPAAAEQAFSKALQASTVPPMAYLNLARVQMMARRCADAAATLNRAGVSLQRLPPQPVALVSMQFEQVCRGGQGRDGRGRGANADGG